MERRRPDVPTGGRRSTFDEEAAALMGWTKLPDWYFDHASWLQGSRLAVWLAALRRTRFAEGRRWSDWSIDLVASDVAISRSAAHRAIAELAKPGRVPPAGARVGSIYLAVSWGRGGRRSELQVLDPPLAGGLPLFADLEPVEKPVEKPVDACGKLANVVPLVGRARPAGGTAV